MYPVLAIRDSIPAHIVIVPTYLRAHQEGEKINFYIAECRVQSEKGPLGIDEIRLAKSSVLRLDFSE